MQKTVNSLGEIEDAFLFELCELIFTYGERKRAIKCLETVADVCVSKDFSEYNQKICSIIAKNYFEEDKIYTKAYVS